jgi:hypothetical protein
VIEWVNTNAPRPSSGSEVLSKEDALDDEDELGDADRIETLGDIVSVPELDEHQQQRIEQVYLRFKENFRIFLWYLGF